MAFQLVDMHITLSSQTLGRLSFLPIRARSTTFNVLRDTSAVRPRHLVRRRVTRFTAATLAAATPLKGTQKRPAETLGSTTEPLPARRVRAAQPSTSVSSSATPTSTAIPVASSVPASSSKV